MFKSAITNFRKWGSCYRLYVVIASVLVFTYMRTDPIRSFAAAKGLSVTPYFFAFQFSDGITNMLFYFGLVLLLCNAPFTDSQQMFVLMRTGRRRWFIGQLLYMFLANICYFLFIAIASILMFIPYINISNDWGTILKLCAENLSLVGTAMDSQIITSYTPIQACMITFIVNVGIGTLISLCIFYGNMFKSRIYGSAIAVAWIVFSNVVKVLGWDNLIVLSPISWANIVIFTKKSSGITYAYVTIFLFVGIALLTGLILHKSKKYTIDALEEI